MNIAFAGLSGAGKSAAADYVDVHYGISRVAFGDYVREEIIEKGFPRELVYHKPTAPHIRIALQEHGAGKRAEDENYWVDKFILDHVNNDGDVSVDDMRYSNEAEALRDMGFYLVWVECPDLLNEDAEFRKHESESGLDDWYEYDGLIVANHGDIKEIYSQLDELIGKWEKE